MSEKIAEPTPGTWHRNIKPAHKYPTVWAGRNTHVAYMATSGLAPEEVEANICLVVASKETLAALKRLRDQAAAISDYRDDADLATAVEAADAAIAKSEGRA